MELKQSSHVVQKVMSVSLSLWFMFALFLHSTRKWLGCIWSWNPATARITAVVKVTTFAVKLATEDMMNIFLNCVISPTTDGSHTEKVDALSMKKLSLD